MFPIACFSRTRNAIAPSPLLANLQNSWGLQEASGNRSDYMAHSVLSDVGSVGQATGPDAIGKAAAITANNQNLTTSNVIIPAGSASWTVRGWVQFSGVSSVQGIIGEWDAVGHYRWCVLLIYSSSTARIYFSISADGTNYSQLEAIKFGRILANEWHCVVADYDGSNISIQIDNGSRHTLAHATGVANVSATFKLANPLASTYYLRGNLAQWDVLVGKIMTEGERDAFYAGGRGVAYPYDVSPSIETVRGTVSGDAFQILHPVAGQNGALVIISHGLSASSSNVLADYGMSMSVRLLLAAGYTIAAGNFAADNCGNQAGVDAIVALNNYCRSRYGLTKTVLVGLSMGGLASIVAIQQGNVAGFVGWAGINPMLDLAWAYADSFGFAAYIDSAYGIPGTGNYATQTNGHDPMLFSAAEIGAIRMQFCASPDDTVVHKANNTDAMVAKMTGTAIECAVIACTGQHGDRSSVTNSDLVTFCNRCIA